MHCVYKIKMKQENERKEVFQGCTLKEEFHIVIYSKCGHQIAELLPMDFGRFGTAALILKMNHKTARLFSDLIFQTTGVNMDATELGRLALLNFPRSGRFVR